MYGLEEPREGNSLLVKAIGMNMIMARTISQPFQPQNYKPDKHCAILSVDESCMVS